MALARSRPRSATSCQAAAMIRQCWFRRSAGTGRLKMGSIGSWMSRSGKMTAVSGIERQLATWPSCARSPSTSWAVAEQPESACGPGASRPPGMTSTCWLYWLDDFMRRPCASPDPAGNIQLGHLMHGSVEDLIGLSDLQQLPDPVFAPEQGDVVAD